jgi:Domain of unknown function (DUF4349)
MKTHRDDFDLTAELRALRPSPSATFADELDARVAAGFAKEERSRKGPFSAIARAIREASLRRLVLPAGATALAALAIATAVVAVEQGRDSGSSGESALLSLNAEKNPPAGGGEDTHFSDTPSTPSGGGPFSGRTAGGAGEVSAGSSAGYQSGLTPQALVGAGRRKVERDAELVLRSEPGEIGENANEVFVVVHTNRGIVLNSSIRDWTANAGNRAAEARANFQLLIPTSRLNDTLASLSRIADVRSRLESTLDITAPTVGVTEQLSDAEARIDSLLAQLAEAGSDEERAAVESELGRERRHAAALGAQLDRLRQRSHFARVSLRIESGQSGTDSGSGTWGVGDAVDDAGRILTIGAGVALIGIAVLAPLALIALLAWWANRAWMRRRGERALG